MGLLLERVACNKPVGSVLSAVLFVVVGHVHAQPYAFEPASASMNAPLFTRTALGRPNADGVAPMPPLNLTHAQDDGKFESVTGNILATVGAGMVGWYLGAKLADSDADVSPALLAGGGALLVAGITFSSIGGRKKRESLSLLHERAHGAADLARLGH
ncbi:MAG: hypothetical protein IPL52_03625 [Flavobacteriales bacterium]|nr:hypothetical protein [Flavobacteriales bacterium]